MFHFRIVFCLFSLFHLSEVCGQTAKSYFLAFGLEQTQFNYKKATGFFGHLDIPVNDRLSVQYTAGFGVADHNGAYARLPLGVVAAGYVLSLDYSYNTNNLIYLLIALAIVPEGVSYTLVSTSRVDFRLHVNPLSIYFWKSDVEWKAPMIPQAGVSYTIKNLKQQPILRLHASTLYQVPNQTAGVQFGIGICISN